MLNVSQFPFVIEVACWAAKREFLKLDKWITDKIQEHHVSFTLQSKSQLAGFFCLLVFPYGS